MSLQLLVILVPVIFGLMGFAIDLGRVWLIRGELHQAASAMALAAASRMAGATASASDNMTNAANQALNEANGNKYNFGSAVPTGTITCFPTLADAAANNTGATADCGGSTSPVFVQASISAPAPLLFWSLLPGGESRTTTVASYAVAGMSSPLCTGCGVVPFAMQAIDASGADAVDWGFVPGVIYNFFYSCTGDRPNTLLGSYPWALLNRVDAEGDEAQQIFKQGAQGLAGLTIANPSACSTAPASCVSVGDAEQIPTTGNATPVACTAQFAADVTRALCGLATRLSTDLVGSCSDFADLAANYLPDTDAAYYSDYASYTGNGRRIITVPLVAGIPGDTSCAMTVVAFRSFLLEPPPDGSSFIPTDVNGRFSAMYLGTVAPLAQGWFDTRYAPACRDYLPTGTGVGPGKVVLHQ